MKDPARNPANDDGSLAAWQGSRVFREAFAECTAAATAVLAVCGDVLGSQPDVPEDDRVTMAPSEPSLLTWRRNLFSTVFQSTYLLLGLPADCRALFAQLNYLFRIWVTATDNLLDREDKPTLPLALPPGAQVMRQVLALMVADRGLTRLLRTAVDGGVVTPGEAARLGDRTLTVLLPSAALEAREERGVVEHPPPCEVLERIHHLKTGILFTVPFIGLEDPGTGTLLSERARRLRDALATLGAGCQILDDIRDFSRDLATRRHNYLAAVLYHEDRRRYDAFLARREPADARLYREVPGVVGRAVALAVDRLRSGLNALRAEGLDLTDDAAEAVAGSLFRVLDVEDALHA